MVGLAKEAPSPSISTTMPVHENTQAILNVEGAPVDILRHFEIDFGNSKEIEKAKTIYEQLSPDRTMGDVLMAIRDIERKIGLGGSTTRINRVWNYLKIQQQITELTKKQEAMKYGV